MFPGNRKQGSKLLIIFFWVETFNLNWLSSNPVMPKSLNLLLANWAELLIGLTLRDVKRGFTSSLDFNRNSWEPSEEINNKKKFRPLKEKIFPLSNQNIEINVIDEEMGVKCLNYTSFCSRNAKVTFVEKLQVKIFFSFQNYKHWYLFYTWLNKLLRIALGIGHCYLRMQGSLNYVNSPF